MQSEACPGVKCSSAVLWAYPWPCCCDFKIRKEGIPASAGISYFHCKAFLPGQHPGILVHETEHKTQLVKHGSYIPIYSPLEMDPNKKLLGSAIADLFVLSCAIHEQC